MIVFYSDFTNETIRKRTMDELLDAARVMKEMRDSTMERRIREEFQRRARKRHNDAVIELIRRRVDIASWIQVKGQIRLMPAWDENLKGICPFHCKTNPHEEGQQDQDMIVSRIYRIFHCLTCGVGGDIFDFVMTQRGLTFQDAVQQIGEQEGILKPRAVMAVECFDTAIHEDEVDWS